MARVSISEFREIKRLARERKEKRETKAAVLWPKKAKRVKTVSQWKRLRDECDNLLSLLVRMEGRNKWAGMCVICRERPATVAYHIMSRSFFATRFDMANVVPSCSECNWAEKNNRQRFRDRHMEIFGASYIEALEAKARQKVKYSVPDLRELRDRLKSSLSAGRGE